MPQSTKRLIREHLSQLREVMAKVTEEAFEYIKQEREKYVAEHANASYSSNAGKGTLIGAAAGSVLGPVGSVLGGALGGMIGSTQRKKSGKTAAEAEADFDANCADTLMNNFDIGQYGLGEQFPNLDGDPVALEPSGKKLTTKLELEKYIEAKEASLATIGEDSQMLNIDLQNLTQKQTQLIQTISTIGKMLHDTAKAVLRNLV